MAKTILVTGGGRGIGRATAIGAGARGWAVGVNYRRDEAAARDTVEAVEVAGGRAVAIAGDVAEEVDVAAMFDAVEDAFGSLDGLVNNAGIVDRAMPLAEMTAERLRRMFDVNLLGAFLAAREAARRMSTSRGGRGGAIVNVSSSAARLGGAGSYVDYAASKGAVDTMTIGLAQELAPEGVRVNAVRPGVIDTEIHADAGAPDRAAQAGPQIPIGRAGRAEEVAEAILWLLGDEASYVTGALLDVAGGR